jgi:hypothetical protein
MPDRNIKVSKLTPGSVLAESVCDGAMTKLLRSGYPIDEHLIKRLADFGVTDVSVHEPINGCTKQPKQPRNAAVTGLNSEHNRPSNVPPPVARDCVCGKSIVIAPPIADCRVAMFACEKCEVIYFGYGEPARQSNYCGVKTLGDGVLNEIESDQTVQDQQATRSPESNNDAGEKQRRDKRVAVALPVVAVPLGSDFRVAGTALPVRIRNLSQGGCALASTRFTDFPYYALDFTQAGIELLQVVLQVLRTGHIGPNYEITGKFTRRIRQNCPSES